MSTRSMIYALAFLTFVAVIDGCDQKSGKPKPIKHRKGREVEASIPIGESGFGLLLRPRNTKVAFKDYQAEQLFRTIDTNNNGMVDAAEWVDYSKDSSIWDFVALLGYIDIDDDEALSLDELFSVQIVEMNQAVKKEDITLSKGFVRHETVTQKSTSIDQSDSF